MFAPTAPKAGKGQIEFTYHLGELDVTVQCDYSAGEPMTRDEPGEPEQVEVCAVYLYDAEISDRCSADELANMETRCLEVVKEMAEEAEIDRYEASREH